MPKYGKASIIGFVTVVAGIVLALAGVWKTEPAFWITGEHSWLLKIRGAIKAPPGVVIVAIDGQTAVRLGQPKDIRFWPRSFHARLIDNLIHRGAAVIVFDVAFMDAQSDEEDRALARAVEQAERIVLLQEVNQSSPFPNVIRDHLEGPIPELADAAKGIGPLPMPKGKVCQFWTFKVVGGEVPTLPAVALQVYALPVLNHFIGVLKNAGFQLGGLARNPADIGNATDLRELMSSLRREFKKNPLMRKRFMRVLALKEEEGMYDKEHTLLTALANLYGGESSYFLNLYGPPATISTIPYDVVLDENHHEASGQPDVADKIVFVGALEQSGAQQADGYPTAFSKDDGTYLSGVEIAATAFANLLTNRMLRLHMPTHLCILLFFGFVVGSLAYIVPGIRSIVVAAIVGGVYLSLALYLFVQHSFWVPVFIPLLFQIPIALFLGLICQYLCTRHEKEKLLPWVPEKIVSVPAVGLAFGTCLQTDIRGSRTLSSKLNASDYSQLMESYFERTMKPIARNGGRVWDYSGDGMMGLFASKRPDMDLRLRACRAALEIFEEVESFNRQLSANNKLPTGIGLHAGWMELGGKTLGDVGNTVSSIEKLNKMLSTRILASQAVVDGLNPLPTAKVPALPIARRGNNPLILRRLGSFVLMGKCDPITVFEMMDDRDTTVESNRKRSEWFADALDAFEKQRWSEAAEIFDAILSEYPEDGPTLFYLQRCRRYYRESPPTEDPSIIRIES